MRYVKASQYSVKMTVGTEILEAVHIIWSWYSYRPRSSDGRIPAAANDPYKKGGKWRKGERGARERALLVA